MVKQIITVLGATGKQGGSVINSILADSAASSKFALRAVTRDVNKDSAKALAAQGAEVVAVSRSILPLMRDLTVPPSG